MAKCIICGSKYNYCPNCAKTHAWKFYADTHEHYQIFMILDSYGSGIISKEDAVIQFENIGITEESDLTGFKSGVVAQIKAIFDKPVKLTKKSK